MTDSDADARRKLAVTPIHQSVLTQELLALLTPRSGGFYLDATFGGGGHSQAILEASAPAGRVVSLDRDPDQARFASRLKTQYPDRFEFHNISYGAMTDLGQLYDGIVFDLGFSSDQLECSGRGFSYQRPDEPLDLRFDPRSGQTAAQFLRQASLNELAEVFHKLAEDRYSKRLAREIVAGRQQRPIRTVADLVEIVGTDNPKVLSPIFQALRIVVNDELNELRRALAAAKKCLRVGGVIAVVAFHSGEDRLSKQFFNDAAFVVLTKKPLRASAQELRSNPRSAAARLRAARLKANHN